MTTTIYYKTIALSALFSIILLKQQSFAGPINSINTDVQNSISTEGNDTDEAGSATSIAVEAATTQPPRPRDMFDGYPEVMKLKTILGRTGLYRDLQRSKALPTALWNTTADNLTEACHEYLRKHLPAEKDKSCAASYVCDVQENFHMFPAVVIRAQCERSRCVNSFHRGIGFVKGSQGSCQPWSQRLVTRLVFKPDEEIVRHNVQLQSGSEPEEGIPDKDAQLKSQQQGTWEWTDDYIPINCQCQAK